MVVSPEYRIYYSGDYLEKLADMIEARQSHYHTYLGAAFCLTFPRFVDVFESQIIEPSVGIKLQCRTVVPTHAIHELILVEGHQYARAGGILYEHIGERRFRGTVNVIYEINGRELHFTPETNNSGVLYYLCEVGGKVVCLW
jgi:CRISPR-associated protein Cas5h